MVGTKKKQSEEVDKEDLAPTSQKKVIEVIDIFDSESQVVTIGRNCIRRTTSMVAVLAMTMSDISVLPRPNLTLVPFLLEVICLVMLKDFAF